MPNLASQCVRLAAFIACFLCSPAYSADNNAKPKVNESAKPLLNSTVKVTAPLTKAPSAPVSGLPTPGGLASKDFAQIQQMRDAKQLKEASEAMKLGGLKAAPAGADSANLLGTDLNRPGNRLDQLGKAPNPPGNGRNPSNDPFGGVPQPTLPKNQDHAPRGGIGGGVTSPPDLKGIMRGSTRQDGGSGSGHPRRITGTQTESSSSSDGLSYHRTTTSYDDGEETTTEWTAPGGDSSYTRTTYDRPSNTYTHVNVIKDENGNVIKETQSGTGDAPPETGDDHGARPSRQGPIVGGGDPAAIQDGESYSGGGSGGNLRNCNPFTGVCFGSGPRSPNQVNPGPEGATSSPAAPALQIDRRLLVTNPNPNAQGTGNTETRLRDARNPVNQVNPPGPQVGDSPRP